MIKRALLIILVLTSFSTFSQTDGNGKGASRFHAGFMWFYTGLRPAEPEKVRKYDRLIIDLTYNTWNGERKPFSNHWSSIGFNVNTMFDKPITKKNTVSIGYGIGYSFTKIDMGQRIGPDSTLKYTEFKSEIYQNTTPPDYFIYGHNFYIPVELRFRTKGWKHFKFHLGGKIGYQTHIYTITRYSEADGNHALKSNNIPDLQRLTYSTHVRVGIRNWALFGSYSLNPLFSNSRSVQLNMIQFGLSLSLF